MIRSKAFSSDVDNQTHVKDVRNFLIGPVYLHKDDVKNENSPVKVDREKPIGIV
tara:strand:+ start:316 stop:477 length:162 start_codon:yes stop_codon:yes gene_type:complete